MRRCLAWLVLALGLAAAGLMPMAAAAQGLSVGQGGGAAAQEEETTGPADHARALVDILKDDAAREALIAELETLAQGEESASDTATDESAAAKEDAKDDLSLGRRIALLTQETAQSIADGASRLGDRLMELPQTFAALDGAQNAGVLLSALRDLALVIVATYAVFILLRRLARPLYRRMGERASDAGPTRTFVLIAGSTVIDALIVIAAWAAGYAIALLFFGEYGRIGIRQTLYLNAFLVVELVKVVMRFLLSPTTGDLRLINITNNAARALSRTLTTIITILGYGQLLVIPIVNQNVSFLAGRAMSALLALVVLGIALVFVLRNRKRVADWLTNEDGQSEERQGGLLRFLARRWHWPVVLYLAALFVIVVSRPDGMMFPVLNASGRILVAILLGMIVTGAITRAISRGVNLPDSVNARLPLLERRLNRFVPKGLMLVRLLVFLAVAAVALDTIGLLHLRGWLESQVGVETTSTILSTALIVLVGFILWLALTSWVDYRLNPEYGHVPTARETTLLTLLRNAATIAILIITLMFALSEIGVDIAPLLASAGVLGLAIGFGAQKLVQDIITGVFIQFESAINVGDVITVGGTTGTVERLTIRSVSLRDLHGAYHIIPFSSVDMVSNYMRDFAYFVCDMGVAYREDIDEVREAMMEAYETLVEDEAIARDVLSPAQWMGVTAFGDNAVTVRLRIKTRPGTQWGLGRAYNAVVKRVFDARGIEMPFPHRTLYFGEDKDGSAPVARIEIGTKGDAEPGEASGTDGAPDIAGRRAPPDEEGSL